MQRSTAETTVSAFRRSFEAKEQQLVIAQDTAFQPVAARICTHEAIVPCIEVVMAKKKEATKDESLVVDDPRVGVGPHDNISPAQVEQAKLDKERIGEAVSPVPEEVE